MKAVSSRLVWPVMTRYLHEQTALLPELKPEDLLNVEGAIGKSTVDAMSLV